MSKQSPTLSILSLGSSTPDNHEDLQWILSILDEDSFETKRVRFMPTPTSKAHPPPSPRVDATLKSMDQEEGLDSILSRLSNFNNQWNTQWTSTPPITEPVTVWEAKCEEQCATINALQTQIKDLEASLDTSNQIVADYETRHVSARAEMMEMNGRLMTSEQEKEVMRNELDQVMSVLDDFERRIGKNEEQRMTLEQEKEQLQKDKEQLAQQVERANQEKREGNVYLGVVIKQLSHRLHRVCGKTGTESVETEKEMIECCLEMLSVCNDVELSISNVANERNAARMEKDTILDQLNNLNLAFKQRDEEYKNAAMQWQQLVRLEEDWLTNYEQQWQRMCSAVPTLGDGDEAPDSAGTMVEVVHPIPFESVLHIKQSKLPLTDDSHKLASLQHKLDQTVSKLSKKEEQCVLMSMQLGEVQDESALLREALKRSEMRRVKIKGQLDKIKETWKIVYG